MKGKKARVGRCDVLGLGIFSPVLWLIRGGVFPSGGGIAECVLEGGAVCALEGVGWVVAP